MANIYVTKRSGAKEVLSFDKIHKVLEWATEGITNVSVSEIELRSDLQVYDGITSAEIHNLLIKSAAELISENNPNYQYVAARLINYKLRKDVYGQYDPWLLSHLVDKNIARGVYTPELKVLYTDDELNELGLHIKHDRDFSFTYTAMEQLRSKYLVQNRSIGEVYETPQALYMLVAATLFSQYPKNTRLKWVKEYYDAISMGYVSLPTPIMAGARTPIKQFSSCVLIDSGDSLDSINATASAIVNYASKKAGIGINAGRIRARGSKVGDGSVVHTGLIPFLKYFFGALRSCSQGGVRGASATVNYPFWHYEFEELIVLKNSKGTEETRIRHLDYVVQTNKLFYERVKNNGVITLFSPHDVPGLYEAFFADQAEFEKLYSKYEKDPNVRKKVIPARKMMSDIARERAETGRIYIFHADHVNTHTPYKKSIKMTNLCVEICLPTETFTNLTDPTGEIALCTLSAVNLGMVTKPSDLKWICKMAVRGLDALLDYQDYMMPMAENSTKKYRPLGVGVINLAYFLAKRGLKYDRHALDTVHEYFEAMAFYLTEESLHLAEEFGPCIGYKDIKYSDGIFPIDTYKKTVDSLGKFKLKMPWDSLRPRFQKTGGRNGSLMAGMPAETSAQVVNGTNGFEKVRALVSYKQSKDGRFAQVVPEIHKLKNRYDLLWESQSPRGYLEVIAIAQKFFDQSISTNTSYNPEFYENAEVPMSVIVGDIMYAYSLGIKTLYYHNTYDGNEEAEEPKAIELPKIEVKVEEEDCDACKI